MRLVDSHSHFDVDAFGADRAEALARAREAGIVAQVLPATAAAGWPRLTEVRAAYPGLYAAYGLHPVYLPEHRPAHLRQLRELLAGATPRVAIGEIGLDYFMAELDREAQQFYFEEQLKLAREFGLPVIVHARRAFEAVIATLRRYPGLRGVVHSFSGSAEQARQLHALGFLLGIGGPVTHARAQRLRRTVAEMPLDQLLLETDAPDQPDSEWLGRRNEPARLIAVLDAIARLRGDGREAIATATTANAERLFGISVTG
ncbi:TatD family deoxyribonuclease [Lysobacter pythonis]|uniref:TatD family deoxyribonuclease n=1 Tax=Solilutibacter pythonis TaxID=2483112 RepID=A0A3M2I6N2_9GAMM|nr:TatD family hydrolase [Lysobacter pythonis]RMH94872.1 TatD family deoxyribonuclease [Lysobacter pythonis]